MFTCKARNRKGQTYLRRRGFEPRTLSFEPITPPSSCPPALTSQGPMFESPRPRIVLEFSVEQIRFIHFPSFWLQDDMIIQNLRVFDHQWCRLKFQYGVSNVTGPAPPAWRWRHLPQRASVVERFLCFAPIGTFTLTVAWKFIFSLRFNTFHPFWTGPSETRHSNTASFPRYFKQKWNCRRIIDSGIHLCARVSSFSPFLPPQKWVNLF